MTTILSIQSHVVSGHVGNAAAVFPLQRLGFEVLPLHTVQFSNHPGHGSFTGEVFPAALVRTLADGLAARGLFPGIDAVLTGYLGSEETGAAVLETVARVRTANPAALYCCDPVIGDTGPGIYVRPGLPELIRAEAVPAAGLLTPNGFELALLADRPVHTLADAISAAHALRARMHPAGPRIVLGTSLAVADTPDDAIDMLAVSAAVAVRLRIPRLPRHFSGAGDLTAALFLGTFLRGRDPAAALAFAANAVHAVLERTAGAAELALIAAQDALAAPPDRFHPEPV